MNNKLALEYIHNSFYDTISSLNKNNMLVGNEEKYFELLNKEKLKMFLYAKNMDFVSERKFEYFGLNTSSENDSNSEIYKSMQSNIINKNQPILYKMLKESNYEMGFESTAEKYFNDLYLKYESTADIILQNIYWENANYNSHILKEILFIITELPKERRKNISFIAVSGLSDEDDEVKDLSIRCFEVWNEKRYLKTLENHHFDVEWLEEYKQCVIDDLRMSGE